MAKDSSPEKARLDEGGIAIHPRPFYPGVVDTSMQKRIRHTSRERFPRVSRFRGYHEGGVLRAPEESAALVWRLATPMASEFHARPVSLDDPEIGRRLAEDLAVPRFPGRDA